MRITYAPDYRSPPSGCGTIQMPDDTLILITSTGGSDYLTQRKAHEHYDVTIDIPVDACGLHYKLFNKVLNVVLQNLGVTHVYDPETAYNSDRNNETYTLDEWFAELDRLP